MKVLSIVTTAEDTHAIRPEIEQFIAIHRQGIQVDIMTQADTEYAKIMARKGLKIVGNFPKSKNDKKSIANIRQLLIQEQYDILHVLQRKAIACGLRAAKGLPTKVVVYRGASGLYWHDPSAYKNALNPRVDKVICVCNRVRDHLRQQLFFRKEKALTIYKGHSLRWYQDVKAASRHALGVAEGDFIVLCVAKMRKWKGIPTLLEAVKHLPQESKIKILLVGNGMDKAFYKKKIEQNKNCDKIRTLGYRSDVMSIAKTADAIMQTSYKNEGLSRSTIEGMALGCVPIVTDAGGNAELVENEKCGIVVPAKNAEVMADAMMKLYNKPKLLKTYAQAAKERIENDFSIKQTVTATINTYKSLINNSLHNDKMYNEKMS